MENDSECPESSHNLHLDKRNQEQEIQKDDITINTFLTLNQFPFF